MLYTIYNGPMPTTAAQVPVTTGTTIKTMLQLKPFNIVKIVEWGVSFSLPASIATIKAELLDTGTVFGTVTASADADVTKLESVEQAVASVAGLTLGTSATGYTCTSEGSITAVRMFDAQIITPSTTGGLQYIKQFPLGREPKCIIGNAVRIRVTSDVACNCLAYVTIDI
jgi:hypothetical protein